MLEELSVLSFQEKVIDSELPVIVEFWAPWCINCTNIINILEEIQEAYKEEIIIYKVNVDTEKELANLYRIKGVPTFLYFVDGHLKERMVGAKDRNDIVKLFV